MELLIGPFRTIGLWAIEACTVYPAIGQAIASIAGVIVLWLAFQVVLHRSSR